jgi:hypothetical protein
MKKISFMITELAVSSWMTIARRSWMMAQGTCSPAEYERMLTEKAEAVQHMGLALAGPWNGDPMTALLMPWHSRATANAKRLREMAEA